MCTPSSPKDNSAEIAREAEAKRQARINAGRASIDQAFGGFDDNFYNDYQNQYTGFYSPQLDDQHGRANEKLQLQLARTGNLTGSVGSKQLADLKKYYAAQKAAIAGRGVDATNTLRSNIDNKKSQLYSTNRSAADPGSAASGAIEAAQLLRPTAPTDPLADVFGDFFGNLGNVSAIRNAQKYTQNTGVQGFGGGSGSSVINVG